MVRLFNFLLVIVTFCCQSVLATPNDLAALKTQVHELIDGVEGLSIGIAMVDENGPVWVEGFGNFENATGTTVTVNPDTMFRIGSVSKMFTALAVLKLVESGQLSLNDNVADVAPSLTFNNPWEETNPVRVVHLLEHTSGWDEMHYNEFLHNDPTPVTLKQGLDFHPHTRTSRWVPGTRYAYSNVGTSAAAYVVQQVSGQDFEGFVTEHLFWPIGMKSASYRLSEQMKDKGVNLIFPYHHISHRPAGSINVSVNDMAKFLAFYLQRGQVNGQQVLTDGSLKRMETAKSTNGGKAGLEVGYGLANFFAVHKQWAYRKHDGSINGSVIEFAYLPSAKVGYAVMANASYRNIHRKISELIRDYQTRNLVVKPSKPTIAITEQHRSIEGFYAPLNSRFEMFHFFDWLLSVERFYFQDGKLKRSGMDGLQPINDTQYIAPQTGLITLVKTTDPLAGEVLQFNNATLVRVNAAWMYFQYGVMFVFAALLMSTICMSVWLIVLKASFKLKKKVYVSDSASVRFWPMWAGWSILTTIGLAYAAWFGGHSMVGQPSWASIGIMLGTIAFPVLALISLYTCFRLRDVEMRRFSYWFWTLAAVDYCLVAAYLAWFGAVGLRTWS